MLRTSNPIGVAGFSRPLTRVVPHCIRALPTSLCARLPSARNGWQRGECQLVVEENTGQVYLSGPVVPLWRSPPHPPPFRLFVVVFFSSIFFFLLLPFIFPLLSFFSRRQGSREKQTEKEEKHTIVELRFGDPQKIEFVRANLISKGILPLHANTSFPPPLLRWSSFPLFELCIKVGRKGAEEGGQKSTKNVKGDMSVQPHALHLGPTPGLSCCAKQHR